MRLNSTTASPDGTSQTSGNSDNIVIRKQVQEVQVLFSATDSHGQPVNDLKPDQIEVLDSGQPVSHFTTFTYASALPLRVAILVDGSDSMLKGFNSEEKSATSVLNGLLDPERDRAFVSVFSAQRGLLASGPDGSQLLPAHFQPHIGGRTALFDVLVSASQHPIMITAESRPVQRVLVLFSDGENNSV